MSWSSVTLVLGGARSGKSAHAESLFAAGGTYIATAAIGDEEMAARIAKHRARRGAIWTTVEVPLDLAPALEAHPGAVLVDCLTLWLSNLMFANRDLDRAALDLEQALARHSGPVALVANEVGLGIVPDNALARAFRDQAGLLNQRLAAKAGRVVFIAAGLALVLKETA